MLTLGKPNVRLKESRWKNEKALMCRKISTAEEQNKALYEPRSPPSRKEPLGIKFDQVEYP